MNTKITPLSDRVLIKKEKIGEITDSGIILPESARGDNGSNIGTVIEVGKGKVDENGKLQAIPLKAGQLVVFSWGEKIEIDDEEYHIVSESNILAIIDK